MKTPSTTCAAAAEPSVRVETPRGMAPLPERLERRPVDAEGWPVPFYTNGQTAAVDLEKLRVCCEDRRCGMCGDPLGRRVAFPLSAKAATLGMTTVPGMHRDCCEWLVSRRLPEVFAVWVVAGDGWERFGARVRVAAPETVLWYFEGAAATRDVVSAALLAALGELIPVLRGVEDTEAVMGRNAALMDVYLPAKESSHELYPDGEGRAE